MLSILAIVLGFGLVIGIHEGSHMLAAKLLGVRVLKFAFGFGPILFSYKTKETSYEIRLLPLGGFVQLDGENPSAKTGFFALQWYKRCLIALAGPVANLILGFVLIFALLVLFKGWPIGAAFHKASELFYTVISMTLEYIGGIFKGSSKASDLSGPVMVTKVLSDSYKAGMGEFTFILATISLSLGLFNLFPIPGLDGGHVALYTAEGIRGKRFTNRVYSVWAMIGVGLLLSLMLYTILLDILKLK